MRPSLFSMESLVGSRGHWIAPFGRVYPAAIASAQTRLIATPTRSLGTLWRGAGDSRQMAQIPRELAARSPSARPLTN